MLSGFWPMDKTHTVRFARGSYPDLEVKTGAVLMEQLLAAKIPVASSCQGKGVCCKCRVSLVSGIEFVSGATTAEVDLLARNGSEKSHRLSCQIRIFGDVTIDTSYW